MSEDTVETRTQGYSSAKWATRIPQHLCIYVLSHLAGPQYNQTFAKHGRVWLQWQKETGDLLEDPYPEAKTKT